MELSRCTTGVMLQVFPVETEYFYPAENIFVNIHR